MAQIVCFTEQSWKSSLETVWKKVTAISKYSADDWINHLPITVVASELILASCLNHNHSCQYDEVWTSEWSHTTWLYYLRAIIWVYFVKNTICQVRLWTKWQYTDCCGSTWILYTIFFEHFRCDTCVKSLESVRYLEIWMKHIKMASLWCIFQVHAVVDLQCTYSDSYT